MCLQYITTAEFSGLEGFSLMHKELDERELPKSKYQNIHVLFRKRLTLRGGDYRLRITADDCYKLYINGRFVAMGPAPSYVWARSYNELSLRDFVCEGENEFAVHVFYQGLVNRAFDSGDDRMSLGFALYEGEKLIHACNETWEYAYDPHYASGGEIGYRTQLLENLDFREKEKRQWRSALPCEPELCLKDEPDRTVLLERIMPSKVQVRSRDEIFVDFGREYVGYPYFVLCGERGQRVTLLCGEETEENDPCRARAKLRCGIEYREELTLSGGRDETDFFDYKGFRYMTLIGEGIAAILEPHSLCLMARHAAYEANGARLIEAEPLVRDIWALCEHTAHYATEEGFLDCPTREKGQYLGDFVVSGLAYLYLTGDPYMVRKTLYDFAESTRICRGMMAVAPGSFMQEIADFSLEYPLALWNYYEYTKDEETARELFPVVEGILAHFSQYEREDGLLAGVSDKWNLVDWPQNLRDGYDVRLDKPIAKGTLHNVINALYVGAHILTERLARALGIEREKRSEALTAAFESEFFDARRGLYTDSPTSKHTALHSNVLPAFFGFENAGARKPIAALIREKGLSCGVQFAYFVLGACAGLGEYELEYELITNKSEHSWYNMLREGATTLFEAWGKEQKWNTSLCHPWASAPIVALCRDHENMRKRGIDILVENRQKRKDKI